MKPLTQQFTEEQFVRLEKISASPSPASRSVPWEEWKLGSRENQGSLPISYTLEGRLLTPIQVGHRIEVLRVRRNGIEALGCFLSTPVVAIREGNIVETSNSVYRITFTHLKGKEAQ